MPVIQVPLTALLSIVNPTLSANNFMYGVVTFKFGEEIPDVMLSPKATQVFPLNSKGLFKLSVYLYFIFSFTIFLIIADSGIVLSLKFSVFNDNQFNSFFVSIFVISNNCLGFFDDKKIFPNS